MPNKFKCYASDLEVELLDNIELDETQKYRYFKALMGVNNNTNIKNNPSFKYYNEIIRRRINRAAYKLRAIYVRLYQYKV